MDSSKMWTCGIGSSFLMYCSSLFCRIKYSPSHILHSLACPRSSDRTPFRRGSRRSMERFRPRRQGPQSHRPPSSSPRQRPRRQTRCRCRRRSSNSVPTPPCSSRATQLSRGFTGKYLKIIYLFMFYMLPDECGAGLNA